METNIKNQNLTLESRKKLVIDGIINVESFSDDYLELSSTLGSIGIEGNELKILELCQESGKILITGEISGIFYRENKKQKSFLGGIFK